MNCCCSSITDTIDKRIQEIWDNFYNSCAFSKDLKNFEKGENYRPVHVRHLEPKNLISDYSLLFQDVIGWEEFFRKTWDEVCKKDGKTIHVYAVPQKKYTETVTKLQTSYRKMLSSWLPLLSTFQHHYNPTLNPYVASLKYLKKYEGFLPKRLR